MGKQIPASRSWIPSGTVATPNHSTPIFSAIREIATAPCPYPLAFTANNIFLSGPIAFRIPSMLNRIWSR